MNLRRNLLLSLAAGAVLGAGTAALSPGDFWRGLAAAGLLCALSVFGLLWAWQAVGGARRLALLAALAFLTRLALGAALEAALPVWGYPDSPVEQAGYLFKDALERDREAFQVAQSGVPLLFNPQLKLGADQYGGLGLLSAGIYRSLSPDAHRPLLMLIPGSFFFALGLIFFDRAVRLRWSPRVAAWAVTIYLFYPDGIFFTLSQMREPYLIGLGAVAFYAVLAWRGARSSALWSGVPAAAGILLISYRAGAFLLGALALLFWLEYAFDRPGRAWKVISIAGLAAGAAVMALVTWSWFREASVWDIVLAQRNSGMMYAVINQLGDRFKLPFILLYGLLQPVLPAALFEPMNVLRRVLTVLRAAGWYALLPLLAYGALAALRERDPAQRRRMMWAALSVLVWSAVVSVRAGGDITDNPRYRTLFLPWMAILAAWGLVWAREHRDAWLGRILGMEAIFLLAFGEWYFSRYTALLPKLGFVPMMGLTAGLCALVVLGGLGWDAWRRRRRRVS